jgi:uncharacterized protein YjiK
MRKSLIIVISLSGFILAGCWPGNRSMKAPSLEPLELIKAIPVDMPAPLEPSGLVIWNGEFYTVADKDDNTIYKVEISESSAKMISFIEFTPAPGYVMDWEGITVDTTGNFYLISEYNSRILQVSQDGKCKWVSPDLSVPSSQIGLFARSNAGFEGITWLGPNHWLGAVEREPRGLVEFRIENGVQHISPTILEQSPFSNVLTLLRIPDYSGLCMEDGEIYALFRNAHLVVRLERVDGSFQETSAWSYKHIETDPELAYIAQTYGQAEGLAISGRDVYLIFDNNLGGRQSNPNDGRPLFVHARMPE